MDIKKDLSDCKLYFVTDDGLSNLSVVQQVEQAILAGVKIVQYRAKEQERAKIKVIAKRIRELTKRHNVLFIVNDYLDIACEVDADGLHIGQNDVPYALARQLMGKNKIIGISCHNLEQAEAAEKLGADYIGFGPVFATTNTAIFNGENAVGVEMLGKVIALVKIPVVAVGGINYKNLENVKKANPAGIVMISALLKKKDLMKEIEGVIRLL